MTAVKLLIVDDHPVVRDGLRGVFAGDPDFDVVGEASDGREALAAVGRLDVDVVLMDLRMPGMGGVAAITELAVVAPSVRVLVLTTFDTDSDVLPAIEAGATGYLLKDAPRDELIRGVRSAARGDSVLSPAVARRLMDRVGPATGQPEPAPAPKFDTLSPRELEVLILVSQGVTNRDAAKRLFLSEATVKTHLLHIYAKLGVNDRAAAVAAGYELGLLTPGRQSDS
jgi:DNA-binding NarL/FixJ family response regulator